ncbi:MAG: hypothetical protein AABZ55_15040 [Bdellovibrionota bacterium]
MRRLILRALNAPALILFAIFGVALQTSLFQSWPLLYMQPDMVLLLVVWVALKREFLEGGIVTLLISDIAEIHSSAPKGSFMICYMVVYLLIRLATKLFVIPSAGPLTFLTLSASIVWKAVLLGVLYTLGAMTNQWKHTLILLFPGALIEAAIGMWTYPLLEKFDRNTFRNPFAEKALDDELQLEGEGF